MYWITYILVPTVSGVLAASGFLGERGPDAKARKRARYKGMIGVSMLTCGVLDWREFLAIASEVKPSGKLLFVCILAAQFGIGLLASFRWLESHLPGVVEPSAALQQKLVSIEGRLGCVAVATAVAMLLVRGGLFWTIF